MKRKKEKDRKEKKIVKEKKRLKGTKKDKNTESESTLVSQVSTETKTGRAALAEFLSATGAGEMAN